MKITVLFLVGLSLLGCMAHADQLVAISADVDSNFEIWVTYGNPPVTDHYTGTTSPITGKHNVVVKTPPGPVKVETRTYQAGKATYAIVLNPAKLPFSAPTFFASNNAVNLFTSVDAPAFQTAGNPFSVGQTFTATNGAFSGAPSLTFYDFTGRPAADEIQLSDPAYVSTLPLFTGSVTAGDLYTVAATPEPSALNLAILCGLGLTGYRLRRWKRSA